MKTPIDIRKVLRDADPAADRELSARERASMRATIVARAGREPRRRVGLVLRLAGAAMVLAAAVLAASRWSERPSPIVASAPRPTKSHVESSGAEVASLPPVPRPILAVEPHRPAGAHRRAVAPLEAGRMTRIVFTAPEGTRIFWFVGSPDSKEVGS